MGLLFSDVRGNEFSEEKQADTCLMLSTSIGHVEQHITKSALINTTHVSKPPKRIAVILLAVTLGPFGAHRLYLGTAPYVPVIYTSTLGGGLGILPLADIIAVLLTKDINKYVNNDKLIMWLN